MWLWSCSLYVGCVGVNPVSAFFFFNDTATTEIYTLSLHDALPIYDRDRGGTGRRAGLRIHTLLCGHAPAQGGVNPKSCASPDRKSTRLNSSHDQISYAVFCLKKQNPPPPLPHPPPPPPSLSPPPTP